MEKTCLLLQWNNQMFSFLEQLVCLQGLPSCRSSHAVVSELNQDTTGFVQPLALGPHNPPPPNLSVATNPILLKGQSALKLSGVRIMQSSCVHATCSTQIVF